MPPSASLSPFPFRPDFPGRQMSLLPILGAAALGDSATGEKVFICDRTQPAVNVVGRCKGYPCQLQVLPPRLSYTFNIMIFYSNLCKLPQVPTRSALLCSYGSKVAMKRFSVSQSGERDAFIYVSQKDQISGRNAVPSDIQH